MLLWLKIVTARLYATVTHCFKFHLLGANNFSTHALAHSPLPCYPTWKCNLGTCSVHVICICTAHVHNQVFTVNTCTGQYKIFRLAGRPARVGQMSGHFQTHFKLEID